MTLISGRCLCEFKNGTWQLVLNLERCRSLQVSDAKQRLSELRHFAKMWNRSLHTNNKDILSMQIWPLNLRGEMDSFSSTSVKESEHWATQLLLYVEAEGQRLTSGGQNWCPPGLESRNPRSLKWPWWSGLSASSSPDESGMAKSPLCSWDGFWFTLDLSTFWSQLYVCWWFSLKTYSYSPPDNISNKKYSDEDEWMILSPVLETSDVSWTTDLFLKTMNKYTLRFYLTGHHTLNDTREENRNNLKRLFCEQFQQSVL